MSGKPWFRMYHEWSSDPKVQALAFEDQRHHAVIMCLQCSGTLDQPVDTAFRERMIARGLGLDSATASEVKRRLLEARLIDENWRPHGWDQRQFEADHSTERVRKHRARKAKESGKVKRRVTVSTRSTATVSETDQIQRQSQRVETPSSEKDQISPQGENTYDRPAVDVARVFTHWQIIHGHPKAPLTEARRALIRKSLKDYSADDLCRSISGYKNSPHHMGENERLTVYDQIELFLRDAKHIDAGLRFFDQPPARRGLDAAAEWATNRRGG